MKFYFNYFLSNHVKFFNNRLFFIFLNTSNYLYKLFKEKYFNVKKEYI